MDVQTIDKLIALLKEVSPTLLAAGRQAVTAQIVDYVVGIVFGLTLLMGSIWVIAFRWEEDDGCDDTWSCIAVLVGALVVLASLVWTFCDISNLLQRVIAPDYYTLKAIIGLLVKQ